MAHQQANSTPSGDMFDHGIFCRIIEGTIAVERDTFRSFIHRKYRQRKASRLRAYHFNCTKLYRWATRTMLAAKRTPTFCHAILESNMGMSESFRITDPGSIRVLMQRVVNRCRHHQRSEITFYCPTNLQADRDLGATEKSTPRINLEGGECA